MAAAAAVATTGRGVLTKIYFHFNWYRVGLYIVRIVALFGNNNNKGLFWWSLVMEGRGQHNP